MAGKTAADLADRLTEILILRGLVPPGTKVSEVKDRLHPAFYAFHSDQGSENIGSYLVARADGDGGAFALLFAKDGPGSVRMRLATYHSCGAHDVHNQYKATQSHPGLHAAISSCLKFLRLGMRLAHYCPLAEFINLTPT